MHDIPSPSGEAPDSDDARHEITSSNHRAGPTWKGNAPLAIRLLISAALLGYVFWSTDWAEVGQIVSSTRPGYLMLSLAVTPVLVAVSAWKWQILLWVFRIHVPLRQLFQLYLVGNFFNNVLPSNVGGDVVRVTELARSTGRPAESFTSVFVERYTGLTILVILAVLSVPLNLRVAADPRILGCVGAAAVGYGLLLGLVVSPRYLDWLAGKDLPHIIHKVVRKAQTFQRGVRSYRDHRHTLAGALANSLLWNVIAVLNVYVSALAFGRHVSFTTLFVTVPLILVVAMVPITFGGLGLMEWAYAFAFAQLGIGASVGLSVALLVRAKTLLFAVAGTATYAVTPNTANQLGELKQWLSSRRTT